MKGIILMSELKGFLKRAPGLNRMIEIWIRYNRASAYHKKKLKLSRSWAFKHTEISNYYYNLTPRNRKDLAFLISLTTGKPLGEVEGYLTEVETDVDIAAALSQFQSSNANLRDSNMALARRIGWYAFARALKPEVIVETGVHHGVGSLVLTSAIRRNNTEGFAGKYFGTDIEPSAGKLLEKPFSNVGKILYGDSIESLKKIADSSVDMFINDSDHSAEYEFLEYKTILPKLSKTGIILGDNSHATDSLRKFSEDNGRRFIFFKEEPLDHFYNGAGIGISLP